MSELKQNKSSSSRDMDKNGDMPKKEISLNIFEK